MRSRIRWLWKISILAVIICGLAIMVGPWAGTGWVLLHLGQAQQAAALGTIGSFWSRPVVRDLVITSQDGRTATVRQMILVSYDGMSGDEIKPEAGSGGRMTVWVYRSGQRFKEAPVEYPASDGQMTPINGYLLMNEASGDLVTFLLDSGTNVPVSVEPASVQDT